MYRVLWPRLDPLAGYLAIRVGFREGMHKPYVIFDPTSHHMEGVTGTIRLSLPEYVLRGMNVRRSLSTSCLTCSDVFAAEPIGRRTVAY